MLMEGHHRVKLEKKMGFVECRKRGWGITVTNTTRKAAWGGKGLFHLIGCSPSIIEGSHSRNTDRDHGGILVTGSFSHSCLAYSPGPWGMAAPTVGSYNN